MTMFPIFDDNHMTTFKGVLTNRLDKKQKKRLNCERKQEAIDSQIKRSTKEGAVPEEEQD